MNKFQESNQKADERRRRLVEIGQKIIAPVCANILIEKPAFIMRNASEVKKLNHFNPRYPNHTHSLLQSLGHPLIAYDKNAPETHRFIEVRCPEASSWYFKMLRGPDHPYDLLKTLDVIFLVPHFDKEYKILKSIAMLTMQNRFLGPGHWFPSEAPGNSTRWENPLLTSGLKNMFGYRVINGECPEFAQEFCAEIMK